MLTKKLNEKIKTLLGFENDESKQNMTYAELIDDLFVRFGIVIMFNPVYTFALKDRVAFYYTVYQKTEDCKLKIIHDSKLVMASFGLAMEDIVETLRKNRYI